MMIEENGIEPSTGETSDYKNGQNQQARPAEVYHAIFSSKSPFEEPAAVVSVSEAIREYIIKEFANL
jgi:hypothetical protein